LAIRRVESRRRAERRSNGTVASVCDVSHARPRSTRGGRRHHERPCASLGNVALTKREQEIKS